MASINPGQDYDLITTLTFSAGSGTCGIRLLRAGFVSGTVYYRAGTSGGWTSKAVSGTTATFPVSSTTMQLAHDWNKSGDNYTTPTFHSTTTLTGVLLSQKAVLSGVLGNGFMSNFVSFISSITSLDYPDLSDVTSVGSNFMQAYARSCSSLITLGVPDTSQITSVGSRFMQDYARSCSSLITLGVPDTSQITSVGSRFMNDYVRDCSSLITLGVPDTSQITSVGSGFMNDYAKNCSSLTTLILLAAGWFSTNNVPWDVPLGRLNNLVGQTSNSSDQSDWQDLVVSGKTLHTNYIRSTGDVTLVLPPSSYNPAFAHRRLLL